MSREAVSDGGSARSASIRASVALVLVATSVSASQSSLTSTRGESPDLSRGRAPRACALGRGTRKASGRAIRALGGGPLVIS